MNKFAGIRLVMAAVAVIILVLLVTYMQRRQETLEQSFSSALPVTSQYQRMI